jgi:hypothetical protein
MPAAICIPEMSYQAAIPMCILFQDMTRPAIDKRDMASWSGPNSYRLHQKTKLETPKRVMRYMTPKRYMILGVSLSSASAIDDQRYRPQGSFSLYHLSLLPGH